MDISTLLTTALTFSSLVATHPGERHNHLELARQMDERSLDADEQVIRYQQCQNTVERRAMQERAHSCRAEQLRKLREEREVTEDGDNFAVIMEWKPS